MGVLAYGGFDNLTPLFGGIVGPIPTTGFLIFHTDAAGEVELSFTWPVSAPAGAQLFAQFGVLDASSIGGVELSNTLQVTGNQRANRTHPHPAPRSAPALLGTATRRLRCTNSDRGEQCELEAAVVLHRRFARFLSR